MNKQAIFSILYMVLACVAAITVPQPHRGYLCFVFVLVLWIDSLIRERQS